MDVGPGFCVALDVTARIAGSTGVARYTEELDRALSDRGVIVRRYAIGRAVFPAPSGTRRLRVPLRVVHQLWSMTGRPAIDYFIPRSDVVHTADLVAPPCRGPSVATVHDLGAIEHPELHPARAVAQQRAQLASLPRVRVVIADSMTTARALVRNGIDDSRIVVAPLGVTPLPDAPAAVIPGADRYVLCVGSLDARKGQDLLVSAWGRIRPPGVALVLAGPDGHRADEIRGLAAALGGRCDIRFEGRVSDARLASLYRGAAAVCAPSRAEGFGLQIVEAMAEGVPVVASDLEAVREVAASAALLVPPADVDALASALDATLRGGRDVAERTMAGTRRSSSFSWAACAEETIKAYERATA